MKVLLCSLAKKILDKMVNKRLSENHQPVLFSVNRFLIHISKLNSNSNSELFHCTRGSQDNRPLWGESDHDIIGVEYSENWF